MIVVSWWTRVLRSRARAFQPRRTAKNHIIRLSRLHEMWTATPIRALNANHFPLLAEKRQVHEQAGWNLTPKCQRFRFQRWRWGGEGVGKSCVDLRRCEKLIKLGKNIVQWRWYQWTDYWSSSPADLVRVDRYRRGQARK